LHPAGTLGCCSTAGADSGCCCGCGCWDWPFLCFFRTSPTTAHLATRDGSQGTTRPAASSPSKGDRTHSAFLACSQGATPAAAGVPPAGGGASPPDFLGEEEGDASAAAAGGGLRRGATAENLQR